MSTRRKFLLIFVNALLGGAAVGSDAFVNATVRSSGDLRVFVSKQSLVGITLKPGRDDEAYVVTDDGEVTEFVLDGRGVPNDGVNKAAETRFERLVFLHNESPGPPIEELYFEIDVTDEGLGSTDPEPSEIESVLFVASGNGDVPGDGTRDFLAETGEDKLASGDEIPFGIGVDLGPDTTLRDLPDPGTFSVTLRIEAKY